MRGPNDYDDPSNDIDAMFPEQEIGLSTEEIVVVAPFKFKHLKKVIALTQLVAGQWESNQDLVALLLNSGEDLLDQAEEVILFGLPDHDRDWLQEQSAEDVVAIFLKIVEVNASFFARAFAQGLAKVTQAVVGASQ
jgi:hypothetical protein